MRGRLPAKHIGIVVNENIIAPPSQFAQAEIANKDQDEIELDLFELSNSDIDLSQTPLLEYFVEAENLDLPTMKALAKKKDGSQKVIEAKAVQPVNKRKEEMFTISAKDQTSARVESRRLRSKQKPYDIQIYNTFDMPYWRFAGGSRFTDVHLEKGHHWAKGLKHEREYLNSLSNTARKQFEQPLELIDRARASALTGLAKVLASGDTLKIGGSHPKGYPVFTLPFTFAKVESENPEAAFSKLKFAYEAFLMRYAPKEVTEQILDKESVRLIDIDEALMGKPIVPRGVQRYLEDGLVTKGAILDEGRDFRDYTWAIVQALEEHYFKDHRSFKGYSVEFPGTDHQTLSIVFDKSPRSKDQEWKNVSMRIVLDDDSGLPYVMYKNFDGHTGWRLNDRDPWNLANISKDRKKGKARNFRDSDWRTGNEAVCTIYEPSMDILDRASDISRNVNPSGIRASTLRGRYIDAMRARR